MNLLRGDRAAGNVMERVHLIIINYRGADDTESKQILVESRFEFWLDYLRLRHRAYYFRAGCKYQGLLKLTSVMGNYFLTHRHPRPRHTKVGREV